MTKKEIQNFRDKYGLDIEIVDHWECPDDNGAKILSMPNIFPALHGKGLQPRTIYGANTWNFLRKNCYFRADYKSEISGIEPGKGRLHCHELFKIDYARQESEFVRLIALSKEEHDFIHSGRLITLYKEGNMYVPKSYLLSVVENGFKIISDYNKKHPDEEPVRCYGTFLQYLRIPSLEKEMLELIKEYDIKFYNEVLPPSKLWKGWHVIVGNKRYDSPYKSQSDWEEAMKAARKSDYTRNLQNPFDSATYKVPQDLDNALAEALGVVDKIPGCKPGRISKRRKEENEKV